MYVVGKNHFKWGTGHLDDLHSLCLGHSYVYRKSSINKCDILVEIRIKQRNTEWFYEKVLVLLRNLAEVSDCVQWCRPRGQCTMVWYLIQNMITKSWGIARIFIGWIKSLHRYSVWSKISWKNTRPLQN